MKRAFIGMMVGLVFASCEKELVSDKYFPGRAEALKNGNHWSSKAAAVYDFKTTGGQRERVLNLNLSVFDHRDLDVEGLNLVGIPVAIGTYGIRGNLEVAQPALPVRSGHYRTDGDAVLEFHKLVSQPSSPHFLKITKIDTLRRYVEGEFEVTFSREEYAKNPYYRDTTRILEFRKGSFQTPIISVK